MEMSLVGVKAELVVEQKVFAWTALLAEVSVLLLEIMLESKQAAYLDVLLADS